jgi:hypothetical protein
MPPAHIRDFARHVAERLPQALAAHHKAEIEKWTPLIKAANIKAD